MAQGCAPGFCRVGGRTAERVEWKERQFLGGVGVMRQEPVGASWEQLVDEVLTGMRDWRTAHPKATFAEIEAAVDERLNRIRARMVEDTALASRRADLQTAADGERPACPHCGRRMQLRGQQERTLTVRGGQEVRLQRSYTTCSACGTGLFPPG